MKKRIDKLEIVKLEVVDGALINPDWSDPMYIINGRYLASSRRRDNWVHSPEGWEFDFKFLEEADVATNYDINGLKDSEGRVWEWIARIT